MKPGRDGEHTPGPWTVEPLYAEDTEGTPFVCGHWIADADGQPVVDGSRVGILRREDAALIVAAPDMLDALRQVAEYADDAHGFMVAVYAAIAKAEGTACADEEKR